MARIKTKHRVWLGSLAILTLLAFTAVPVIAASSNTTKIYGVAVTPADSSDSLTTPPHPNSFGFAGSAGQVFKVKFSNLTPGNSSFNSFKFNAPADFVVTDAAVLGQGAGSTDPNLSAIVSWETGCHIGPSSTATPCPTSPTDSNVVFVQFLDPVSSTKAVHEFVTIAVTVTTPALASDCSGTDSTWASAPTPTSGPTVVYTGSNLSGDTFAQQSAYTTGTTTTLVGCLSLAWGQVPVNGLKSQDITPSPTVEVVDANNNIVTAATGTVTISIDGTSPSGATLTGNTATLSSGVATFLHLRGDKSGNYTVQASSGSLTSASAPFTLYDDGIACSETKTIVSNDGTTVVLERPASSDNNGDKCTEKVPFSLDVTNDTVDLLKDQAIVQDQEAKFILTITWAPVPAAYPDPYSALFDIDGSGPITARAPSLCHTDSLNKAQYPANPDGSGSFFPAGTAEFPWCLSSSTTVPVAPGTYTIPGTTTTVTGDGMQTTEIYLGAGDPTIRYK